MISFRYVPAIAALLVLPLVPTIIHSYGTDGAPADGRSAAAISPFLGGYTSVPTGRNATWAMRRFASDDWMAREYVDPSTGEAVSLTVVRTLDAKSVYHHPELAIEDEVSFVGEETRRFPERPDVPVHVLQPGPGVRGAALYALHYDDGFVENPIAFQIRAAGELLFSRRQPMTLFFVFGASVPESSSSPAMLRVLFAAIDNFLQSGGDDLTAARE